MYVCTQDQVQLLSRSWRANGWFEDFVDMVLIYDSSMLIDVGYIWKTRFIVHIDTLAKYFCDYISPRVEI